MERQSLSHKLHSNPTTALVAVAYQDHLIKEMALGDLSLTDPVKRKRPSLKQALKGQERHRINAIKNCKSTLDTGRKRKDIASKLPDKTETEYILDPKPRPLTLAQKMGLIACNEDQRRLLTEQEWKELKLASTEREDFTNPCVICKDEFRMEDQVLLSCSHVFHRACLKAFERFTGKKTCPMCRRNGYQTRVVHDGTKAYRHRSAAKIQAYWRGYVVRKWYLNLRRTVPPKNPKLRKTFYENKLSEITDRLVAMAASDHVDRFLDNIDESIQESRNIFMHWDKMRMSNMCEEEWLKVSVTASARGATECPICLRNLNIETDTANTSASTQGQSIALLSCSHVFHATCLNALEQFSLDETTQDQEHITPQTVTRTTSPCSFKCPVCRAFYTKRLVDVF
uniref:RING finger protein 32-like n=1 Tax=Phallusia mammillata TaxID=59560 RepID=A0A6F9DQD6_9ASCI|nr:RING finger protein 32-like [Phallusia mammillata]